MQCDKNLSKLLVFTILYALFSLVFIRINNTNGNKLFK